jgi:hypothetical protein
MAGGNELQHVRFHQDPCIIDEGSALGKVYATVGLWIYDAHVVLATNMEHLSFRQKCVQC